VAYDILQVRPANAPALDLTMPEWAAHRLQIA
jgi:hypothetical protein